MKIGFKTMGSDLWYGGVSHLKCLLFAVRYSYKNKMKLALLASNSKIAVPDILRQKADEIINFPTFKRWSIPWVLDRTIKHFLKRAMYEEHRLRQHKIDVVFGPLIFYSYRKIPTLSFIPDFQHVHLPEMFSIQECLQRDQIFLRTAELSTRVILMSEAAKKDFQSFAPKYAHKARILKTANYIPDSIYESDLKGVLKLYNLPEKFIYLPNQFWKHKNHEVVFQAIKILKNRGLKILVVCSGYPGDDRHPTYFADLFQQLSKWDIRNQVIYLGMIPYEHVLLLIRQSVCVLNPSLFEGFGLTVSESVAIGKRVLLSDISAHREHDSSKAIFFDPYNCEDLAKEMSEIWQLVSPGPDSELEFQARQNLPERLRACADSFLSVVREVV